MKLIIAFYTLFYVHKVDGIFLSLLYQLEMINPVVIGNASDLRTNEMFQLMKETMRLSQTILLTTTIRIEILQKSPGILIRSDNYTTDSFFWEKKNTKISKPWIITGRQLNEYSRIDEPVYVLDDNNVLWEQYKFKSLKKSNELGRVNGNVFQWNEDMPVNTWDRRGNFDNLTLIAVTESGLTCNFLPNDLEKSEDISNIVSNSFEVTK